MTKVRKNIVIKKLGRAVSDKIHVNGEPFELVSSKVNNSSLEEAKKIAEEYSKDYESRYPGFIPYLAIGVYHGKAEDLYMHRWSHINKQTNELTEFQ